MDFEEQLRDRFHTAVETITPPPAHALVDGGVQRGRRLKRQRMVRAIGGVATVVVLGGAGFVAADRMWGGFAEVPGATEVASGDVQAVPNEPEQLVPVTAQAVVQILIELLPSGQTSQYGGTVVVDERYPDHVEIVGELVFDDGLGESLVTINLSPAGAKFNGPACPLVNGDPNGSCTTHPDGSTLVISDAPEYGDVRRPDLLVRYATLTRSDGMQVSMSVNNSATEKSSPVTRPEPALSAEQLAEIVNSPLWQPDVPASVAETAEDLFVPRT